jgi:hypothetical protein
MAAARAYHGDGACGGRFLARSEDFLLEASGAVELIRCYRNEVEDVIVDGEHVMVLHRGYSRNRSAGPQVVFRRVTVWTLRECRIVVLDFNVPYAEVLAAGLGG